jgi:hypothetical protein
MDGMFGPQLGFNPANHEDLDMEFHSNGLLATRWDLLIPAKPGYDRPPAEIINLDCS